MTQPVAAGNQVGFIEGFRQFSIHNAVHEESSALLKQHHFSRRNFNQAGTLDRDPVAGKNCRHHARSKDAQANDTERADHFPCQSTRRLDRSNLLVFRQHLPRRVRKLSGLNCSRFVCW